MFVSGRQSVARVDLQGEDAAIAKATGARLAL
jgi:hypothetical protein